MHYYSVNIMLYLLFIFNKPEEKVMTLSIMEDRYSKENGMPALAETQLNDSTQGSTLSIPSLQGESTQTSP